MTRIVPARWSLACLTGLVLGLITSAVPFLLWRRIALGQGHEFVVDVSIILCLVVGSWLFTRTSINLVSASLELLTIVLISSVITTLAVVVMDSYGYEPITLGIILNCFPASSIFALPSFLLVFIGLLFKYRTRRKGGKLGQT